MKKLTVHICHPSARHVAQAEGRGDDSLGIPPADEFYEGTPAMPGYERAEPGCLIATSGCVMPHTDHWLGGPFISGPAGQKSLFWVLKGVVQFKVDGWAARTMVAGEWVVFDHRREHMVLANEDWLGAAWQIKPVRKARAKASKPTTKTATP